MGKWAFCIFICPSISLALLITVQFFPAVQVSSYHIISAGGALPENKFDANNQLLGPGTNNEDSRLTSTASSPSFPLPFAHLP